MEYSDSGIKRHANRRSFLKLGTVGVGTAVGTTPLPAPLAGFEEDGDASLTRGDIAILTFVIVYRGEVVC
ncbi:MAG TPA: twin-arginine translocation signal domain-containing protein [Terriglobales bacterium]|nr:twin-arginine translocation signal domain-containing protein [Terriglobales bacterium]